MEKKLIKSIFLRFKTNNIRLKIQRWQHRAGSTPAAGILQSFKKDSRLISSLFSFIKQINELAILLYKILSL